jgi:KR domain-containing protein
MPGPNDVRGTAGSRCPARTRARPGWRDRWFVPRHTHSVNGAPRILLLGGYGVFGRHLATELLCTTDARIVLAGRDRRRAESACEALGAPDRIDVVALDVSDTVAVEHAALGCTAVACTVGPFQGLPIALPAAAVRAGAHWFDVADDPAWVLGILDDAELHDLASEHGVSVIPGLSAVPAVSGALVRVCRERSPAVDHGRITLFIGNRNDKGAGATASALISGFTDPQWVDLPLGRKRAYRFATPDRVLLQRELGIDAEFRVALEWAYLGWLAARFGRTTRRLGASRQKRIGRWLSRLSVPFACFGTELGCVQVELWSSVVAGANCSAVAIAGQRLVVLPCALAVQQALEGSLGAGVSHPATWLPVEDYLARLGARGVRFTFDGR